MERSDISALELLKGRLRGASGKLGSKKAPTSAGSPLSARRLDEAPPFSAHHAKGLDRLYESSEFGLLPPFTGLARPILREVFGRTGVELMFIRVDPGDATPFAMRHRKDEVVYIVTSGRGQFLMDGQAVEVAEGSVLRVSPATVRAWRNTASEDLCLLVIQARARRFGLRMRSDAVGLPGRIAWPTSIV
ncbi:cupin domain-containing protein [Singulisphaera sp. PoT]|uniref:cupin domain-containing protein n=1 Tax=Singulisphaera sp. PoT TaxID=3411797 RepID=UPI003BF54F96